MSDTENDNSADTQIHEERIGRLRELDMELAEVVMHFRWMRAPVRNQSLKGLIPPDEFDSWRDLQGDETIAMDCARFVPRFSSKSEEADKVLEEMASRGFWAKISTPFTPGTPFHAGFTKHGMTGWNGRADYPGSGQTMAEAICRAALLTARCGFGERLPGSNEMMAPE